MSFREVASHAETHPGVLLRTEQFGDVFQPVVTSGTPLRAQAQRAERQGDVVRYDEQVLRSDLPGVHPVADGLAREIHVGRRLEQHECPALVFHLGDVAVTRRGKNSVGRLCEGVQHFESDVVTGFGVLGADIPQSNDEVFHTRSAAICPRRQRLRAKRA